MITSNSDTFGIFGLKILKIADGQFTIVWCRSSCPTSISVFGWCIAEVRSSTHCNRHWTAWAAVPRMCSHSCHRRRWWLSLGPFQRMIYTRQGTACLSYRVSCCRHRSQDGSSWTGRTFLVRNHFWKRKKHFLLVDWRFWSTFAHKKRFYYLVN